MADNQRLAEVHMAAVKHQRETALDALALANAQLHVAKERIAELEDENAKLKALLPPTPAADHPVADEL